LDHIGIRVEDELSKDPGIHCERFLMQNVNTMTECATIVTAGTFTCRSQLSIEFQEFKHIDHVVRDEPLFNDGSIVINFHLAELSKAGKFLNTEIASCV
jgi:hypothetical protein